MSVVRGDLEPTGGQAQADRPGREHIHAQQVSPAGLVPRDAHDVQRLDPDRTDLEAGDPHQVVAAGGERTRRVRTRHHRQLGGVRVGDQVRVRGTGVQDHPVRPSVDPHVHEHVGALRIVRIGYDDERHGRHDR